MAGPFRACTGVSSTCNLLIGNHTTSSRKFGCRVANSSSWLLTLGNPYRTQNTTTLLFYSMYLGFNGHPMMCCACQCRGTSNKQHCRRQQEVNPKPTDERKTLLKLETHLYLTRASIEVEEAFFAELFSE